MKVSIEYQGSYSRCEDGIKSTRTGVEGVSSCIATEGDGSGGHNRSFFVFTIILYLSCMSPLNHGVNKFRIV